MLKKFDLQKYKNTNKTSHFKCFLMIVVKQDFNMAVFKKQIIFLNEPINNVYFYTEIAVLVGTLRTNISEWNLLLGIKSKKTANYKFLKR
jgi:hypothetical protein